MPPRLIPASAPALPAELAEAAAGYAWMRDTVGQSDSTVYRLQAPRRPSLYLKHAQGAGADDIGDEALRLAWLGPRLRVPEVRHFMRTPRQAWLLMTEIPGLTAYQWLERHPQQRDLAVNAMAAFLRRLHAIPTGTCPFDSTAPLRLARARQRMDAGDVDASDFDAQRKGWTPQRVWDHMMALLPALQEAPVVTHGDFSLDNLLMEDGCVVGCIDCARVGVADRYQDLAILWNCLGEFDADLQALLLRAYGVEPDDRRLQFHLCLDEFF